MAWRVSGMLVLTWLTATLRASLALVSGHTFIYFALPAVFGLVFVATLAGGREPLIVRLARDLVPSAADSLADRRAVIRDLSVLWAISHFLSAAATLLLLMTTPLSVFVAVHVATGWLFIAAAGAITVWIVRRREPELSSPRSSPRYVAPPATPLLRWLRFRRSRCRRWGWSGAVDC